MITEQGNVLVNSWISVLNVCILLNSYDITANPTVY